MGNALRCQKRLKNTEIPQCPYICRVPRGLIADTRQLEAVRFVINFLELFPAIRHRCGARV